MSDFTLSARPALGGFRHDAAGVSVSEVTGFSLVSLAVPLGGEGALAAALRDGLGLALPEAGSSTVSRDGRHRLLWTAPDQTMLLSLPGFDAPVSETGSAIGGAAYLTDQSDAWAALRLSGERIGEVLERMAPVDTAPASFGPGRIARTVIEHMGVILVRDENGDILMLCARSSARSFLHAVMTTVEYLAAP
ncbi:sarcosine oxidase subunit gamma [Ostreiculturibacter nitratireducens]|uniref:sarcosine oxidase subunit gamma n=1 Tax=Ostreiculturibacter nitratireducens TaxID=3075226 RepID=UPI0031B5A4EB